MEGGREGERGRKDKREKARGGGGVREAGSERERDGRGWREKPVTMLRGCRYHSGLAVVVVIVVVVVLVMVTVVAVVVAILVAVIVVLTVFSLLLLS